MRRVKSTNESTMVATGRHVTDDMVHTLLIRLRGNARQGISRYQRNKVQSKALQLRRPKGQDRRVGERDWEAEQHVEDYSGERFIEMTIGVDSRIYNECPREALG